MKKEFIIMVFCLAFLLFGAASRAQGATLAVTKIADTNDGVCNADCSLREAIDVAAAGDTIVFASPLFDTAQTILLSGTFQQLIVDQPITIYGRGANLTTISMGGQNFRVFLLIANSMLSGLTITGGRDTGSGQKYGAGVFNQSNSTI